MAETEPSRGGVLAAVADGGGITGFASFGPSRDHDADPRRTGEVFAIYVDPDACRRRNHGRGAHEPCPPLV